MNLIDQLASIFGDIPAYIWLPIAQRESGLNPFAHNPSGEDSRGLYQINVQAHPELSGLNLYDPIVNATVARDYFIRPAYEQVKNYPDPAFQAEYVWRYGIRPNWSQVVASGGDVMIRNDAQTVAASGTGAYLAGAFSGQGDTPTGHTDAGTGFTTSPGLFGGIADALKSVGESIGSLPDKAGNALKSFGQSVDSSIQKAEVSASVVVAIVLLAIAGFVALGKAFGADSAISEGIGKLIGVATKGVKSS